MPAQLADDRRDGVGAEVAPAIVAEPVYGLDETDGARLHEVVRSLVNSGRTVVLVSHFLREVLDLADTVTILRDGSLVRTGPTAQETESTLVAGMLGRSVERTYPPKRLPAADAGRAP